MQVYRVHMHVYRRELRVYCGSCDKNMDDNRYMTTICMYVCMLMLVYVLVSTTGICVYIRMYVCIYLFIYVCMCVWMYVI